MMDWDLSEILAACDRLLNEEKNGTAERHALSSITKTLKRCVQELRGELRPMNKVATTSTVANRDCTSAHSTGLPPPASAPTVPSITPEVQLALGDTHVTEATHTEQGPTPKSHHTPSDTSLPREATVRDNPQDEPAIDNATKLQAEATTTVAETFSALQKCVSSEEIVSRLGYACRLALRGLPGGAGASSVARSSVKVLTASLELAAVLLDSGIVPTALLAAPPPQSPLSGASGPQMFFSKMFGSKSVKPSSPATINVAPGEKEDVRLALVDAVLSVADAVQAKDPGDKVWFVFIAALLAAAVPRVSRASLLQLAPSQQHHYDLCVHEERLTRILHMLFSVFARQGISPILVNEAKEAVRRIAKALSKYVEEQSHQVTSLTETLHVANEPAADEAVQRFEEDQDEEAVHHVASKYADEAHDKVNTTTAITKTTVVPHSPTVTEVGHSAPGHDDGAISSPANVEKILHCRTASLTPVLHGVEDVVRSLEFCAFIARGAPLSTNPSLDLVASGTAPSDAMAPAAGGSVGDGGGGAVDSLATTPLFHYTALIQALSLILHLTVNGGPTFRKAPAVIRVIKRSVIPAVVRTSLSSDVDVFRLSLNILLTCCLTFGPQLVSETSTVFRHVFFRVLESKFTSLTQKSLIIEAFQRYIEEPQHLIGLFLNYDCNTASQSIYEEMIGFLAALAAPASVHRTEGIAVDGRGQDGADGTVVKSGEGDTTSGHATGNNSLSLRSFSHAEMLFSPLRVRLDYDVPETLRRKAMLALLLVAESNIQWIERFETNQVNDAAEGDISRDGVASPRGATLHRVRASTDSVTETDEGNNMNTDNAHDASGNTATSATTSRNDTFQHARRFKEALRHFLYLFNVKGNPEAALEYLHHSALNEETEQPRAATAALRGGGKVGADDDRSVAVLDATNTEQHTSCDEQRLQGDKATAGQKDFSDSEVTEEGDSEVIESGAAETKNLTPRTDVLPNDAVREARQAACFLKRYDDYIDRNVLGEFFAKSFRKTSSRLVFEEWIGLHNFTGMTLDAALRLFLGGFKLLGEAQVVDKTMELFAAQYCSQNPSVFSSADTAFILSFSICMLNTDAHSPHVKNKMTKEGFLRNNSGIDEGNDLDPALLSGIYDRITQHEIVLRPSLHYNKPQRGHGVERVAGRSAESSRGGVGNSGRVEDVGVAKAAASILESIPLLRHLVPIASSITDTVQLPMDAGGAGLTLAARRKREEMYQRELRDALRNVMNALQTTTSALPTTQARSIFVTATSVENALPMWEVTVDLLCRLLVASLLQLFEESEQYRRSPSAAGDQREGDPVQAYMQDTNSALYFQGLLRGLVSTVHVCCAFGNVSQVEILLEQVFQLTQLSQTVVITTQPQPMVHVVQLIPGPRLWLLSALFNLFLSFGHAFTARGWQVGYAAVSAVDALANGIEGIWQRQTRLPPPPSASRGLSSAVDIWFGFIDDAPTSVAADSLGRRRAILSALRATPTSAVDLWLERLFDPTRYPSHTQLQMANGLLKVCQKELQHGRTFSVTKLFDFVSICAATSSRMQWRELWADASVVFVMAGRMRDEIATAALDGLRIIALNYLMKEELLNYSFQREVLKPFEGILMSNQDVAIRRRIIGIIAELIDFRAEHLASGWGVVFSCLSHAAVIPEVVELAWEVCARVSSTYVHYFTDCFSDFIFCLTSFACTNVIEMVPLCGISFLVACGHWLQYGLESLPQAETCGPERVVAWAGRFPDADAEAQAAQGHHLARVTLALEPITRARPLVKPESFLTKTKYHLWMSLFEGQVPIVVVHSLVRVRAHAICSMWALVQRYAVAFSAEVQLSLFSGMLRPVLNTLMQHVPRGDDVETDRGDYRLLLYLALKGMLVACQHDAQLLEVACTTLVDLVDKVALNTELLRYHLVDVLVRICADFVSAAAPRVVTEWPFAASSNLSRDSGGAASHDTGGVAGSTLLVALANTIRQIGAVDVVHNARTTSWTELHHTPVAITEAMVLPAGVQQSAELRLLVSRTVWRCLANGLWGQLRGSLATESNDRTACLLIARGMRQVMLGLGYACIVTGDEGGVLQLLQLVRAASNGDQEAPPTHGDEAEHAEMECGEAMDETHNSEGAAFRDDTTLPPKEILLLIPYACILIEFVCAASGELAERLHGPVRREIELLVDDLRRSRHWCIQHARCDGDTVTHGPEKVQAASSPPCASPDAGAVGDRPPCQALGFVDVFSSVLAPVIGSHDDSAPEHRQTFMKWMYLMRLMGIRCALQVPNSYVAQCISVETLIQLLPLLPSELEEEGLAGFWQSCWHELDLPYAMPSESIFALCMRLLQTRLSLPTPS